MAVPVSLAGRHGRQIIEQVLDVRRALQLELLGVHDGEGAGRGQVRLADARTGDGHFSNGTAGRRGPAGGFGRTGGASG